MFGLFFLMQVQIDHFCSKLTFSSLSSKLIQKARLVEEEEEEEEEEEKKEEEEHKEQREKRRRRR